MASLFSESLRAFLKPIVPYLDDPAVSEVMMNGPADIWVEKGGRLFKTDAKFSEEGALAAARNLAQFVGRPLTDERPTLDARLPDGSRVHVVMPPVARSGCTIAIRKFMQGKLSAEKLIQLGSMNKEMIRFLEAAVAMKFNIIVSGGTGSGKTTLLNALSTLIPNDERVLTIEDSAELQLQQEHLVSFETRPPDKYGKGEVDMSELLRSALRLRPDRIVVGEVRGGECFTLLQAMNTGHGGSLATAHANTPVDTLRRLESLALMSAVEMPLIAVRAQVASAIHLVVCCERFQDGSRRTTHIAEVLPLDDKGDYRTVDLFAYTPVKKNAEGRIIGYHAPTGVLPSFFTRFGAYGFGDIGEATFDPLGQGLPPPANAFNDHSGRLRWVKSMPDGKPIGPVPPPPADNLAATPPTPPAPTVKPAVSEGASSRSAISARAAPPPAKAAPRRQDTAVKAMDIEEVEAEEDEEPVQEEKTALHPVPEGFRR
jgi:pilus assembly protein CpaF